MSETTSSQADDGQEQDQAVAATAAPVEEPEAVASSQESQEVEGASSEQPVHEGLAPLERIRAWRQAYQIAAETTPLEDVGRLAAQLDLTHAHPSGIAQLFASGHVHLNTLFRDNNMLRAAHRRLERVLDDLDAKERQSGSAQLSIVVGVATWSGAAMPVLLYPIEVEQEGKSGNKAIIRFTGRVQVNGAFLAVLRNRGIDLDAAGLFDSAHYQGGTLETSALFKTITAAVAPHINDFSIEQQIILGCFVEPSALLLAESQDLIDRMAAGPTGNALLDALAGDQAALEQVQGDPLPQYSPFDADPHAEFEVGDVDNKVRFAAALAASGHSVLLDEVSGRNGISSSAAVAARCLMNGRTVLYVPCVVEQKRRFERYMDRCQMSDLVLDLQSSSAKQAIDTQLIEGVAFKPGKATARFDQLADELVGVRSRLTRYLGDLHGVSKTWGVSAYQTIQNLAQAANLPTHPATRVRLSVDTARQLRDQMESWGNKIERAAQLGEFTLGPQDTPWFGAAIYTEDEAVAIYERVVRLLEKLLPATREQVASTVETCGFPVPQTAQEWGKQMAMLKNLRRVLDIFQPDIFERDIPAMIEASESKDERKSSSSSLGFWERRRLVKEAKALVRVGTQVDDLHAALLVVARQAKKWREFVPHGGWPVLPAKLDHILDTYEALSRDMTALDTVLASTPGGGDLETTPFEEVEERLRSLFDDHIALDTLPERCNLDREFKAAGLQELITDLRNRQVPKDAVRGELSLAWWTTVFDDIMHSSRIISNQDGSALSSAAERFNQVDLDHVMSVGPMVGQESQRRLTEILFGHKQEANQLHAALTGQTGPSINDLIDAHPTLMAAAKPIMIATPATLASQTRAEQIADVAIIDAGAHTPSIQVLSILARVRQVVVVAHQQTMTSDGLIYLSNMLVPVRSQGHPARRSPLVVDFLRSHGYGPIPYALVQEANRGKVVFTRVSGNGVPAISSGLVESSQQEINAVVGLLRERAASFSNVPRSYIIAIVTFSQAHRVRLGAELKAQAAKDSAFALFLRHVRIVDIDEISGTACTDAILSIGFAKTSHGRLLQQFGKLEGEGGSGMLLDALAVAERHVDVVSAFGSQDMEDDRLHQPGPKLLKELLVWSEQLQDKQLEANEAESSNNVLFADLAQRLEQKGLEVALDYGFDEGMRIPMVVGLKGQPYSLAVVTDDADFMHTQSTRERHRFRLEDLERLGWSAMTAWSVSAFVNPDKEADRIAQRLLGSRKSLAPKAAHTGSQSQVGE
ncbi:helicase [Bombiscardovia apis]|uniref:Helicase n=1 Tax=Bombiscardovia apis TaxID=2932182 RepID=A0ABM8BE64_9BIFI|nr:helicase [Bombiscardovia apis]BDR55188.1 helicase [Bombiscardovia apis]